MPSTATSILDGLSTSVAVKAPCVTASTANLTLSGLQTVDGVALVAGDRVLVKDQTTQSENGIYDASTGSWTRSKDFDGNRDVRKGTLVLVETVGSVNIYYRVTSSNPIVIGTSSITFETVSGTLTQAIVGAMLYPRSDEEIAASVTPTSTVYPYGHVWRYGADPTGVADSATAFQSALNSHPGEVYVPPGTYKWATAVTTVDSQYISIRGAQMRRCKINWTGGASTMLTLATSTEAEIENLQIDNNGTAVRFLQTNSLHTRLRRLYILPVVPFSASIIRTRTDDVIEFFSIRDSLLGGYVNQRTPIGVDIQQANNVLLESSTFENMPVMVKVGKTPVGGQESGLVRKFDALACTFQSTTDVDSNIAIDLFTVKGVNISSYFQMSGFVTSPNDLAIKIRSAEGAIIAGSIFDGGGQQNYAIEAADANARNIKIIGNNFRRIVLGGAHITAGTQIEVDNNTLDAGSCPTMAVQTNNTFSPGVDFGGASVGLTYGTRLGRFQRQGNWAFVQGAVTLTAKGSSTGQARITNLPFASEPTASNNPLLNVAFINGATLAGHLCAIVSNNSTTAILQTQGAASVAGLTDANFTNTTTLFFTGAYQVTDA